MSRDKMVTFRLSYKEYEFINEFIKSHNTTLTEFIRKAIFQAIANYDKKDSSEN